MTQPQSQLLQSYRTLSYMSNNYRVESFKYEHFALLNPRDPDTKALAVHPNHENIMRHYTNISYAFTGFHGDTIIGIGGLNPLWEGVAEAWIFTGEDFARHKRFVFKEVKRHLDLSFQILKLNRIQAVCVKDFEGAHTFAKHLGFELEADTLKNYMFGRDYSLYARTKND